MWPLDLRVDPVAFSSSVQGLGCIVFPNNERYISSTSDGGKTWTKLSKVQGDDIIQIDILEDGTVFALEKLERSSEYRVRLIRIRDGGHNWNIVKELKSIGGTFSFTDLNTGYVMNYNKELYKTTDGGDTWISIPQQEETWKVSFASEGYGWGLVMGGHLACTGDGGQTWNPISIGNNDIVLSDIRIFDQNNYILTGHMGGKYSILHSQDGGRNFKCTAFTKECFNYIDFVDSKNIFAVDDGRLYRSTDGGITFGCAP